MLPELSEIAKKRRALGYTQAKLAELISIETKTDISRSLIAKLEKGYVNPSYKQAKNIFDTLEALENKESRKSIIAGQIHNMAIEYANASERILDVWKRMEGKAYSQLPVKGDGGVVGSITERDISSRMLTMGREDLRDLHVRDLMGEPFPTVGVNTPKEAIIPLLQNNQAILTIKGDKIVGIITNTELINSLKY